MVGAAKPVGSPTRRERLKTALTASRRSARSARVGNARRTPPPVILRQRRAAALPRGDRSAPHTAADHDLEAARLARVVGVVGRRLGLWRQVARSGETGHFFSHNGRLCRFQSRPEQGDQDAKANPLECLRHDYRKHALNEHRIDIPMPQREVYVRELASPTMPRATEAQSAQD
jgi:hypothetical protein